jgi:hypothetical protein
MNRFKRAATVGLLATLTAAGAESVNLIGTR